MTAADRDPPALPPGLRERVLAASLRARAVGRPVPDAPEISAAEAYRRAAGAFYEVLCFLGDHDWRTPVLRGLDVQGLVGHLIGVEDDVRRCLSGAPEVADASHVESTQAAAIGQAWTAWPYARRLAPGRRLYPRPGAARGSQDSGRHARHALVAGRAACRPGLRAVDPRERHPEAAGWAASVPDASTLRLMTSSRPGCCHTPLPGGLAERVDVRLVLTGPGGGPGT